MLFLLTLLLLIANACEHVEDTIYWCGDNCDSIFLTVNITSNETFTLYGIEGRFYKPNRALSELRSTLYRANVKQVLLNDYRVDAKRGYYIALKGKYLHVELASVCGGISSFMIAAIIFASCFILIICVTSCVSLIVCQMQ